MERDAYVANDQAMADAESKWKAADPTGYAQYAQNPSATKLLDYEFNQKMLENPAFKAEYGADYYAKPADERAAYVQGLTTQGVTFGDASTAAGKLHQVQTKYGVGSSFGRAAQALTGLASGIAGGNVNQGLSAAAAPLLANAVGTYFDNQAQAAKARGETTEGIEASRLLAHAAVGAAVAYASGNDASSGAFGAVSGEAIAQIVSHQLYGDKDNAQLTQQEKENVRAVATLASALVGAAAGGSFEDAAVAASAGHNAAVNNSLKAAASAGKIIYKAGKRLVKNGRIKMDDLKQIIKDEGLDILDNVATLADGTLSWDDGKAIIDLVVGTSFNGASKGKALEKINEIVGNNKVVDRLQNVTKQDSPIWGGLRSVGNGRKATGSGSNTKYFEWDHTHNDIEVYDRSGRHLGSMNPVTGEMYKPAVTGRRIKL
jgi:hypothetical protein